MQMSDLYGELETRQLSKSASGVILFFFLDFDGSAAQAIC